MYSYINTIINNEDINTTKINNVFIDINTIIENNLTKYTNNIDLYENIKKYIDKIILDNIKSINNFTIFYTTYIPFSKIITLKVNYNFINEKQILILPNTKFHIKLKQHITDFIKTINDRYENINIKLNNDKNLEIFKQIINNINENKNILIYTDDFDVIFPLMLNFQNNNNIYIHSNKKTFNLNQIHTYLQNEYNILIDDFFIFYFVLGNKYIIKNQMFKKEKSVIALESLLQFYKQNHYKFIENDIINFKNINNFFKLYIDQNKIIQNIKKNQNINDLYFNYNSMITWNYLYFKLKKINNNYCYQYYNTPCLISNNTKIDENILKSTYNLNNKYYLLNIIKQDFYVKYFTKSFLKNIVYQIDNNDEFLSKYLSLIN